MALKFIIVAPKESFDYFNPQGRIRFGNVIYHKDLRGDEDYVFGGGDFRIDEKTKTVYLSGNSGDFGYPQLDSWEWTKFYVDPDLEGYRIVYKDPSYTIEDEIDLSPLIEYMDE